MPALSLRGLEALDRWKVPDALLLRVAVAQLGDVENAGLVAQRGCLVERARVAPKPRKGSLNHLRVDTFQTAAQPLD
eukprot:663047-Pyramimonas_sp.AAC.1